MSGVVVRRVLRAGVMLAVLVAGAPRPAEALSITFFDGWSSSFGLRSLLPSSARYFASSSENADLFAIMEAAATLWEQAILDPVTVQIGIGYFGGGLSSNTLGAAAVTGVSGSLIRGVIGIAAPHFAPMYRDQTPLDHSEFGPPVLTYDDLGAGPVNTGINMPDQLLLDIDMFSVALHEIGHVLAGFVTLGTMPVTVSPGLPFAGSVLPNDSGHLMLSDSLMFPVAHSGRQLISDADLLFVAMGGGYTNLVMPAPPVPVPEPATALLVLSGLAVAVRRRRSQFVSR